MFICMCTCTCFFFFVHAIFRVWCIIVLVAARCAANAVAQICKMLSFPSKCILICGCKYEGKGFHLISKVWTRLILGEVET